VIEVNGVGYFLGPSGLWKTDGTEAGTVLVKGLTTLNVLANVNGTLFLAASDGVNGEEPWRSDGTTEGTVMIADLAAGTASSRPQSFVDVDGGVFFTTATQNGASTLWKSDGTSAGTVAVKTLPPNALLARPSGLINLNGKLLFNYPGAQGIDLWVSDGTEAGTMSIKSYGLFPTVASDLVVLADTAYQLATIPAGGGLGTSALFKSDGTADGTVEVATFGDNAVDSLTKAGSTLFFRGRTASTGIELWKSDGTGAGTGLVKDIRPGSANSGVGSLRAVGGTAFFSADDGTTGTELWRSDGSAPGTVMVKDIAPGAAVGNPT
jgi:ELWxxDGT repeat protein